MFNNSHWHIKLAALLGNPFNVFAATDAELQAIHEQVTQ